MGRHRNIEGGNRRFRRCGLRIKPGFRTRRLHRHRSIAGRKGCNHGFTRLFHRRRRHGCRGLPRGRGCPRRARRGRRCGIAIILFLVGTAAAEKRSKQRFALPRRGVAGHHDGSATSLALFDHRQCLLIAGQRLAVGGNVNGLAVRKQRQQFAAAHARPVAHIADIHMHERRAGPGIIANAADLVTHTDGTQLGKRDTGDEIVHRAAKHMLALLGNAARTGTQHGVGRGRTIG